MKAPPSFFQVYRWPSSMAQYTVGHHERVLRVEERLRAMPGLFLAGSAYYGIGVSDCVRQGKEAAEKILNYLDETS